MIDRDCFRVYRLSHEHGEATPCRFDTDDDQVADFKFRHARGRDEVVLLSDRDRTRPAVVSKVTKNGLSIRFQEGAIRTPSTYRWYAAYEKNGKVLDRDPDETWIFHNLEVHD